MKRQPIKALPSQEELLKNFVYDEASGKLFRLIREGHAWFNSRFAGREAGYTATDGYQKLKYKNLMYLVQRVVWKMKTGNDPIGSIDHIDGDKSNNRFNNLRDVTHDQNMWNAKLFHNNTSGYRGVSFINSHKRWRAAISVNGQKKHLGYFSSAELAHVAFKAATDQMRDEYARVV